MQKAVSVGLSGSRKQMLVFLAAMALVLMAYMVVFGTAAGAQTAQGVDLNVKKSVSPKVVAVGERQTFTIKVTNEGNRRARNVTMSDPLPGKVKFVRASTSRHVPGSCGLDDRTVVCHLGTLRPGKTVAVWIVVRTVEAGDYTNRAFVSYGTSALESDTSDNQDTVTSTIVEKR
jgi:uncharacterized repeat protein (TIGR01451 family)